MCSKKDTKIMEYALQIKTDVPFKNYCLVWWCKAKHWSSPTTRHILFEDASFKLGGGDNSEYTSMIYCNKMVIVPTEYHNSTGRSLKVYLFLLSIFNAYYLFAGSLRFFMYWVINFSYSWLFWSTCSESWVGICW